MLERSVYLAHNKLLRELNTARLRATREKDIKAAELLWSVYKSKANEIRLFLKENPECVDI